MKDYRLRFDDEQQANEIIGQVTNDLHPSQYVRYDIGQIKHYEYDEANPDAEPVVTIVSDKWHVDLRLRTANDLLDEHSVVVNTPIHNFS